MRKEDIKQELEEHNPDYRGQCHDCGTSVSVLTAVTEEGAITIEGGAVYKVKQGFGDGIFFKCDACFKKDKTLRNWRQCEVYSRVVGYLRPVNQWNEGKKEEFKMRKEFKNAEGL
jgi:predicted nucleic acid-binding Zn ribbon protein